MGWFGWYNIRYCSIKTLLGRKRRNMSGNVVEEIAFIIFLAVLTAVVLFLLLFSLCFIISKSSYRKRMKPLNEAEAKQREEEKERRKKLLSS